MFLKRTRAKPQIIAGEKKKAIRPFLGPESKRKFKIIIKYAQPESREKINPPNLESKIFFIFIVINLHFVYLE